MSVRASRSVALLALLALLLPGLVSTLHLGEHEHAGVEAELASGALGSGYSSVVAEACERDGATHIEGAELVEFERCAVCVRASKSKLDLDGDRSSGWNDAASRAHFTQGPELYASTVESLHPSRAPPRA